MIFWNLYSDYDVTEHSIEFKNVRTINPIQITRIQEIEEDGLKYTRFYSNNSDKYYYPGTLDEFNQDIEDEQKKFDEKHPFFDCVLCCPMIDESTFMFTNKSINGDENSDAALTFTISLTQMMKDIDRQWKDVFGEDNEEPDTSK